jgi:hypothetical protein
MHKKLFCTYEGFDFYQVSTCSNCLANIPQLVRCCIWPNRKQGTTEIHFSIKSPNTDISNVRITQMSVAQNIETSVKLPIELYPSRPNAAAFTAAGAWKGTQRKKVTFQWHHLCAHHLINSNMRSFTNKFPNFGNIQTLFQFKGIVCISFERFYLSHKLSRIMYVQAQYAIKAKPHARTRSTIWRNNSIKFYHALVTRVSQSTALNIQVDVCSVLERNNIKHYFEDTLFTIQSNCNRQRWVQSLTLRLDPISNVV